MGIEVLHFLARTESCSTCYSRDESFWWEVEFDKMDSSIHYFHWVFNFICEFHLYCDIIKKKQKNIQKIHWV